MTRSEMILEFIDGTLEGHDEQGLFDDLARRPEMRAELRQFITIGEAVRTDREAFIPPIHVERALFSGLGLAPLGAGGAAGSAAGAAATGWLAKLFIGKAFLPMIASFLVGAALAGGGVYVALNGSNSTAAPAERPASAQTSPAPSSTQQSSAQQQAAQQPSAQQPSATPQEPSAANTTAPNKTQSSNESSLAAATPSTNAQRAQTVASATPRTRSSRRASALSSQQNAAPTEPAIVEPNTTPPPVETLKMSDRAVTPVVLKPRSNRDSSALQESSKSSQVPSEVVAVRPHDEVSPYADVEEDRGTSWMLEARRGFGMQPFSENNARQVASALTDDGGLGIYHQLSSSFAIGLEGGRGRYTQTLPYQHGDTLVVEQRPSITWVGLLAGRYTFDELFPRVQPFFNGVFGYALKNGPMADGRFGLQWNISQNFRFAGALETSGLIYRYSKQTMVTGKWGITLGANLAW